MNIIIIIYLTLGNCRYWMSMFKVEPEKQYALLMLHPFH